MALYPNGSRMFMSPTRFIAGAAAHVDAATSGEHGGRFNKVANATMSRRASVPEGMALQGTFIQPIKPGGMAATAVDSISNGNTVTAAMVMAKTATATMTNGHTMAAGLGALIQASCTLLASNTLSGTMQGSISMAANMAATGNIGGAMAALAKCISAMTATGTIGGNLKGTASASASLTTEGTVVTANTCAAAVWNALAASFNTAGTMGEKLNDAGSAGNPWATEILPGFTAERMVNIIAAAVAGKVSGAPTAPVFRNLTDTQDQITGTVDANGNRTAVTLGS